MVGRRGKALLVVIAAVISVACLFVVPHQQQKTNEDILVLIYETEESVSTAQLLLQQSKRVTGVDAQLFGQGDNYQGFGSKYASLQPVLASLPRETLVVVSDGRDVLLNHAANQDTHLDTAALDFRQAFENIIRNTPNAVVFSAEAQCCVSALTHVEPGSYFDANTLQRTTRACASGQTNCQWDSDEKALQWESLMQEQAPHVQDAFLNAGLVAGRANNLLHLVRTLNLEPTEDDQAVLTDLMLLEPSAIRLDYHQELFGNNRVGSKDCIFALQDDRVVHTETLSTPLFVHSPGGLWKCHQKMARDLGFHVTSDHQERRKLGCNYKMC